MARTRGAVAAAAVVLALAAMAACPSPARGGAAPVVPDLPECFEREGVELCHIPAQLLVGEAVLALAKASTAGSSTKTPSATCVRPTIANTGYYIEDNWAFEGVTNTQCTEADSCDCKNVTACSTPAGSNRPKCGQAYSCKDLWKKKRCTKFNPCLRKKLQKKSLINFEVGAVQQFTLESKAAKKQFLASVREEILESCVRECKIGSIKVSSGHRDSISIRATSKGHRKLRACVEAGRLRVKKQQAVSFGKAALTTTTTSTTSTTSTTTTSTTTTSP